MIFRRLTLVLSFVREIGHPFQFSSSTEGFWSATHGAPDSQGVDVLKLRLV